MWIWIIIILGTFNKTKSCFLIMLSLLIVLLLIFNKTKLIFLLLRLITNSWNLIIIIV